MFDEHEVVSRILRNDLRAFELLVNHYEKLVFFVIHRLVQDKENKEDICQEVFIKIHHSLPSFRFESKLATWIGRIAYLTAVNYLKSNKNLSNYQYPENIDNYHFTAESPETELIKKNTSAYVNYLCPMSIKRYLRFTISMNFHWKRLMKLLEYLRGHLKAICLGHENY